MKKEIYFERHWKNHIVILTIFLVLQIVLSFGLRKLWTDNKIFDFVTIELICVGIGGGLLYQFVMQRYLRFYEEGISFVRFFRREFITWSEVREISNVSRNQHPVIRLKGNSSKIDILVSEYEEKAKLIEYIELKTSKRCF